MRLVSYILMQLAPGTAKTAAEKIAKIQGVKMAHAVTCPFDVIAFAEVPDLTTLSDLLLAKIQNIEGVQKTQTAVVVTPGGLRPQQIELSQLQASISTKRIGRGHSPFDPKDQPWNRSERLRLTQKSQGGGAGEKLSTRHCPSSSSSDPKESLTNVNSHLAFNGISP